MERGIGPRWKWSHGRSATKGNHEGNNRPTKEISGRIDRPPYRDKKEKQFPFYIEGLGQENNGLRKRA